MKKILIIFILLLVSGCRAKCECQNKNCGQKCKLQCEDNRCSPGVRCCDKCTCDTFKK